MAATNQSSEGSKTFYKLKENKELGENRFYLQEKKADKWVDGKSFNQLDGVVTDVRVKEFEWQGEKKTSLIVTLQDGKDTLEFQTGFRSMTAQSILNTLAGDNPFKLYFVCGKPKNSNGKSYTTLYINKDGATNEERRTQWKYSPNAIPKITTETDDDGNKIKRGQKAADAFWMVALKDVQERLKKAPKVEYQKTSDDYDEPEPMPF